MRPDRRSVLAGLAATGVLGAFGPTYGQQPILQKPVPSTGEHLPVIGLGSWITFNVGSNARANRNVASIIDAFFARGGRMIDSSPMYGSSQAVIGRALTTAQRQSIFAADKVWTSGRRAGVTQMNESSRHWRVPRFALLQVHNLLDWQAHLETLFAMKERGELAYVGVTTSHGRRHREIARIMEGEPLDFIQLTYNMSSRSAEHRVLPLASEKGIAVIANRPFDGGRLVRRLKRQPLTARARALGFTNWADFALKFVVSHPGITCAIPATTRVEHLHENMNACQGSLPNADTRQEMLEILASL